MWGSVWITRCSQSPTATSASNGRATTSSSASPSSPPDLPAGAGAAGPAMFIDEIDIFVKGGDGGAGCVSFRREKFVPRGGPDGGDGGDGGSIFLEADPAITTLLDFHYQRHYNAKRGQHGKAANLRGPSGSATVHRVLL